MTDLPDGTYLTDEINIVQVVGINAEGLLVCEDVSGPVEETPEPKLIRPTVVRPADARRVTGRWRVVIPARSAA